MKAAQLELDVKPRRVRIDDGAAEVVLRVDKRTAAAVNAADPVKLGEFLETEADRLHKELDIDDSFVWITTGCTDWFDISVPPTCSGYWETLRPNQDPKVLTPSPHFDRLWYDAEQKQWRDDRGGKLVYTNQYWRGLVAPAVGGYTYQVRGLRVRIED